jgi:hypothetical protein
LIGIDGRNISEFAHLIEFQINLAAGPDPGGHFSNKERTMSMMNTVRTPVSIERAGITHRGYFEVDGPTIRMSHKGSTKVTQLGGHARVPKTLARMLLSELVRETGAHHA